MLTRNHGPCHASYRPTTPSQLRKKRAISPRYSRSRYNIASSSAKASCWPEEALLALLHDMPARQLPRSAISQRFDDAFSPDDRPRRRWSRDLHIATFRYTAELLRPGRAIVGNTCRIRAIHFAHVAISTSARVIAFRIGSEHSHQLSASQYHRHSRFDHRTARHISALSAMRMSASAYQPAPRHMRHYIL